MPLVDLATTDIDLVNLIVKLSNGAPENKPSCATLEEGYIYRFFGLDLTHVMMLTDSWPTENYQIIYK